MKLTAKQVPFSSVVGSSVTLHEDGGRVVAQLAILLAGGKDEQVRIAEFVTEAINNTQKSGGEAVIPLSGGFSLTVTMDESNFGERSKQRAAEACHDGQLAEWADQFLARIEQRTSIIRGSVQGRAIDEMFREMIPEIVGDAIRIEYLIARQKKAWEEKQARNGKVTS